MAEDIPSPELDYFKELLADVGKSHMPFGKYGPAHYPPRGVPIYDLSADYLGWFKQRGFPKGRLGQMMDLVYETKVHGADHVFNEFRTRRGGRTDLREKKVIRKNHTFID